MKKQNASTFLILMGIVILSSCKTAPVYNIKESEFAAHRQATMPQIKQAIIRGAKRSGWNPAPVGPGKIMADYT